MLLSRQQDAGIIFNKDKDTDFTDILIANKIKSIVVRDYQRFRGCFTFDMGAQSLPQTKAPIG
ncbi:MAG: hypothetical protein AB2540_09230 [Candidatus Thiodiazotropha endolucinida]